MAWLKYGAVTLIILLIGAAFLLYKGDLPADMVDAKYSNDQSEFLILNSGTRVHYRDEGKADGPAMVLVHGSNASLHTWEPWVEILGEHFRMITLDLPGHGLTGKVPDDNYSSEAQVATVEAIVNHLKVPTFVLGGNSMGGGVTWRYALAYPEKVTGMILVDASGLPQWWEERMATQKDSDRAGPLAFRLLAQPWFRTVARYLDPYQLTVQGLASAYNHSPVVDQALIDRYYELSIREGTRDATMKRFSIYRGGNIKKVDLTQLTQPTLVMWGREDALIPASTADQFAAALPNADVVIYDEVGHIPMEEVPERSAQDVLAFSRKYGLLDKASSPESPSP